MPVGPRTDEHPTVICDVEPTTLTIWGGVASLVWIVGYCYAAYQTSHLERLATDVERPSPAPKLSVVVPARNEVDALPETLASLVELDYPALEVVVVDDRSDDGTADVAERFADEHECIRAVHVDRLPEGWLGKVHALHRGFEASSGEFVVFTDADVRFAPDVLDRATAEVVGADLDHLALAPTFVDGTFWHALAVDAFLYVMLAVIPTASIEDPESETAAGIGAFNLVRREILESGDGLKWLRLEITEDMGIGRLVKRAGGTSRIAAAPEGLAVEWYRTLPEFVRGLEKNAFAKMGQYSLRWTVVIGVVWVASLLGPPAALLSGSPTVMALGATALAAAVGYGWITARRLGRPRWRTTIWVVGQIAVLVALVRSTWICWRRGALVWRDTEYSLDELRRHQRITFP